MTAIVNLPS